jgi:SAM-dependent methyltransferase
MRQMRALCARAALPVQRKRAIGGLIDSLRIMTGLSRGTPLKIDTYFARSVLLPEKSRTEDFLNRLPLHAHVLDFGSGSGRWAAAFQRDREDITIDLLDANLHDGLRHGIIPSDWKGMKIQSDFRDFHPAPSTYDGVWAYHSLFFLKRPELHDVLHRLAISLKPGGVLHFTIPQASSVATALNLCGLERSRLEGWLQQEGLVLDSIRLETETKFGKDDKPLPMYHITARKPDPS